MSKFTLIHKFYYYTNAPSGHRAGHKKSPRAGALNKRDLHDVNVPIFVVSHITAFGTAAA